MYTGNTAGLNIYKWCNQDQRDKLVGFIYNTSRDYPSLKTCFVYNSTYVAEGGSDLDPRFLKVSDAGEYAPPTGSGDIPFYFRSLLLGPNSEHLMSELRNEWSQKTEYEKLEFMSQYFNEYGAISIEPNSVNAPPYPEAMSMEDVESMVALFKNYSSPQNIIDNIAMTQLALLGVVSGGRPKFSYYDFNENKKYLVKLNYTGYCDDAKVECFMRDLEELAGITTVPRKSMLIGGENVLFQESFSERIAQKQPGTNEVKTFKYNKVNFDLLTRTNSKASTFENLTYESVVNAIEQYSSDPDSDKLELFRRAYFSVSVNHTNNGLSNIELIDVGVNEWRLCPSYHNMPNPYHSSKFDLALGANYLNKRSIQLDANFAAKLGAVCKLNEAEILRVKFEVDTALSDATNLLEQHDLSESDLKVLHTAMPELGFDLVSPSLGQEL